MKKFTLQLAFALGFLVCAGRSATAQPLSTSAPILIQLSEIDRYDVSEWSLPKPQVGARLGLPYRDMKQSDVETLVSDSKILSRPVWIMDGARVIAKGSLIGQFEFRPASKAEPKYGFCLGFDSAEEAQKIKAIVKLEPSEDEWIRQQKSRLNDQRTWIF